MSHFVEVPREAFIKAMTDAGFTELPGNRGELVFIRRNHNNEELLVKIYSSIPRNAVQARDCGEDAIRVVAVYEPPTPMKSRGYYKAKVLRVTSVDGVLQRTLERAREAYAKCNEAAKVVGKRPPKSVSVRA